MGRALQVTGWMVAGLVLAAGPVVGVASAETDGGQETSPHATLRKVAVKAPPYDPTGKRDPFQPLGSSPGRRGVTGHRTPLQQFELSQLRLVAIIRDDVNPKAARAVVEDGSGLGYIMAIDTAIGRNDGRVTAIETDRIVIEEWPVNVFGERRRSIVVKELDAGEEARR